MARTPDEIIQTVATLRGARSNWESHWQEIGDYIIPRKNDINLTLTPGVKRNSKLLDNTGMQACELLAGALHGMLTSPTSTWFELTSGDPAIDDRDDVRKWLQDSVLRVHNRLNNSNFQTEVHEFYLDLCGFNTAGMSIVEDDEMDVLFQTHFLKEIFIRENNRGIVDEIYRVFQWEAKKIVQEFGKDKTVPDYVYAAFEAGKDQTFDIIHCTYKSSTYDPKNSKPILSDYVLVKEKKFLRQASFQENPWVIARWAKASGETYGRGPGMNALPEVKMVNLMEETMIQSAQRVMNPAVQLPDDGFVLPLKMKPGGINFYRAGSNGKDRIEPIFNNPRIDFGFQIMDSHRQRIKEAFYVDQLTTGQGPQMTATEVVQRTEEKMKFLGPLLGRLQVEFLSPLIDRVFAIMLRRNRFLPPPGVLSGKRLDVRYSSAIAKVQRSGEAKSIVEAMSSVAPFIQMDPSVIDNIDSNAALRGIASMFAFPQKFLRDQDEVTKIRAQRQQAQDELKKQQQDLAQAQAIKDAGPVALQANQQANANGEVPGESGATV